MNIFVLGSTGLLGSCVADYLKYTGSKHTVITLNRNHFDATCRNMPSIITDGIRPGDVVINCVGVLKPNIKKTGLRQTIMINSHFPQLISDVCVDNHAQMIHICSDCVFSGELGQYVETDVCDATDIYAKTKSITPDNCTVIRTSFVGDKQSTNNIGLINWLKSVERGTTVDGYTNCVWNGVTTLELSRVIEEIINTNEYWTGVRHLFTPDHISKYDLCSLINDQFNLNLNIRKTIAHNISGTPIPQPRGRLDRTLSSIYTPIVVPTIDEQLYNLTKLKNIHASI